ncbi:MAG: hypothetical protein QGH33_07005, partial [Pirellulaceae bacterium]|nr:hypothetical protein [Pirellulaceae bacterium]
TTVPLVHQSAHEYPLLRLHAARGFEFAEATVWAERHETVNCRVTPMDRLPWKEWDFKKPVYTRCEE